MKYRLPSVVFRSLLGVWLLVALGGCTLYHKVVHPYRLPTPKPSPEFIAQQKQKKEDEKLKNDLAKSAASVRKKSGGDAPEAATDVSTPSNAGATASTSSAVAKGSVYPERSTVRYDKQGLMKKPKLDRRKRHKVSKGFHPIESIRNLFKYGFHAKPNYSPDHRPAPKQPSPTPEQQLPDEAMPTPAPAAPAAEPTPGGKP